MEFIKAFLSLGTYIILPIMMFALAVLMRAKLTEAFRGALYIGIALLGISMISSYFLSNATPVIEGINAVLNKKSAITDVGWPVIAMLAWNMETTLLIVPIHILVNLIMLKIGLTSNINVDIFNFWHLATASLFIKCFTDSIIPVIIADVLMSVIFIKLTDWANPSVKALYDIDETQCISTANGLCYMPFAVAINWLIDKIPFMKKVSFKPERIDKKYRLFIDPGFIALIVGTVFSFVAGLGFWGSVTFGMKLAAVFVILPLVTGLLREGFTPVSQATAKFAQKYITKGRPVYVGVNQLITGNNPSLIITTIILIPIIVIFAAVIPSVGIFPMGDLMNIISIVTVIVAVSKGDVIRSVISSIPVVILNLFCATYAAQFYTQTAAAMNYDMGGVTGSFAASLNGNMYVSLSISEALKGNILAISLTAVIAAGGWLCYRFYKKQQEK